MRFVIGEYYTRDEIHDALGGDKQSYLPRIRGKIVCGCFDPKMNPDAPREVLISGEPGSEVDLRATMLEIQGGGIPIFLKQSANHWMFDGIYRLQKRVDDPKFLRQREAKLVKQRHIDSALIFKTVKSPTTPTYLLTWNPEKTSDVDFRRGAKVTKLGRTYTTEWSCGNTKRIQPGDRIFLLRQGSEPRGILASGWADSASYLGDHWNEGHRKQGKQAIYVQVRFDRILHPEKELPLLLGRLKSSNRISASWRTPASGVEIRNGAGYLEQLWAEHLQTFDPKYIRKAFEGETIESIRRHRSRETWLRYAKIEDTKRKNEGRLRCEVPGCRFDFLEAYGEIGRDYAQVHHLKPLSDRARPSETTLSDLAIVCANCHVMIHKGRENRSLQTLLKSKRRSPK